MSGPRRIKIGAIIYLHDISYPLITRAGRLDIKILKKLCGDNAISRGVVSFASTKWSRVSQSEGEETEQRTMTELWGGLVHTSCPIHRIKDAASARVLLSDVLARVTGSDELPMLHIERELTELERPFKLSRTEAGRCLSL